MCYNRQYSVGDAGPTKEDNRMELQDAYIRVFGAAAAALDELAALGDKVKVPEVVRAKMILKQAIDDTEEYTDLAALWKLGP